MPQSTKPPAQNSVSVKVSLDQFESLAKRPSGSYFSYMKSTTEVSLLVLGRMKLFLSL